MLKFALPILFAVRSSAVYALLRRRLGEIIPLNKLLGIEITSVDDGAAEARLPFRAEITNHLGTVHATAIFGLAEAASGGAMSGAFAPDILKIRPVASQSEIRFVKIARGDLTAEARTVQPSAVLRDKLAADGKVSFEVSVKVRDQSEAEIASVAVTWHVSLK
jgi:uncharacterized protein (TIGR00369 family)